MSDNQEVFTNLLSVTREQLSKSMAVSAELEALLIVERRKVADLESQIEDLKKPNEKG
jgi:hypothetical protein